MKKPSLYSQLFSFRKAKWQLDFTSCNKTRRVPYKKIRWPNFLVPKATLSSRHGFDSEKKYFLSNSSWERFFIYLTLSKSPFHLSVIDYVASLKYQQVNFYFLSLFSVLKKNEKGGEGVKTLTHASSLKPWTLTLCCMTGAEPTCGSLLATKLLTI